jgi:glycosyltransferase involved in cell wall biosynthesis
MNVFNEAKTIAKAIQSVHEQADEIWLYDGAYKEYPHTNIHSTDGTIEIASKFPKVKVFQIDREWENQLEKRTAMFSQGQEGDVFLKLDGDEYVTNPEIIRDHLDLDVGWIWTISNLYPQPVMTARLFKYQKGMHYAGRHHWLYSENKDFITSDQHMNLAYRHKDTPIRVFNFRCSSKPERISDKQGFLVNRNVYERKYQSELEVYKKKPKTFTPHPHRAGQPIVKTKFVKYCETPPTYTFTLMFSRPWAVNRYFSTIRKIKVPERTEMVVVIDTDSTDFANRVVANLKGLDQFQTVKYHVTGNPKLPEFKKVAYRRQRIIDNWHILLTESSGEIILGSEDDSLPEPDAYIKLLEDMEKYHADFVQANIIGRWAANMIPAWHVIEKEGKPIRVESGMGNGVEKINGMGWYCFVASMDVFRKVAMRTDDLLPLGPDVRFGYDLSRLGHDLYHDYSIPVIHFGETFQLDPQKDKHKKFTWEKLGDKWFTK